MTFGFHTSGSALATFAPLLVRSIVCFDPTFACCAPTTTGDPEKDKKIRKVNDKLTQIAKLKEQVKSGKKLEVNQLEKIKKESELLEELKSLRL